MLIKSHRYIVFAASLVLFGACGGGGGTPPDNAENSSENNTGDEEETVIPQLSGFDFKLHEGDFWEYGWRRHGSSYAQGSSGKSWDSRAEFRITLGSPIVINGKTAYSMKFSGQPHTDKENFVADRWTHIAIDGYKIYASKDGETLAEIFDAVDGKLLAAGFFRPFGGGLYAIVPGILDNVFYNGSAYQVSQSFESGQCEYFPEVGQTICGSDMQITSKEREYYLPSVGPIGYYYYNAYNSCGGGFCSGSNDTIDVGLVATSLRGDVVTYALEQEPNNSPDKATILALPATVKGGFYKEDSYGQTVTVGLSPVTETEPANNISATAQVLSLPAFLNGDTKKGDGGETLVINNFPNNGVTYNEVVEDWFVITPTVAGTYKVDLDFSGGVAADLDLLVLRKSDKQVVASGVKDNMQQGTAKSESATFSATNQPYYVAVDAYNTSGERVNYTLSIYQDGSAVQFTPADWYQFELNGPDQVKVQATGGVGLLLVDAANNIMADEMSGGVTSMSSPFLQAGVYRVGVVKRIYSSNRYEMTVDVIK